MKIQEVHETAVDRMAARLRPAPAGAQDPMSGEETGSVRPRSSSSHPSADYSKELEKIAEAIRKYIHFHKTSVDISLDEELRQIVTKVLDEDSGEVVRQYPPETTLAVMRHLKELRGLLLHRKG